MAMAKGKALDTESVRAVDLVAYQDDAIVSREILRTRTGAVTVFAFDEGQGLSEHRAPFDALVHVLEGEAEIVISGKSFLLKDGEMILMPADELHSVRAIRKFKMMLTMIKN